MHIDDFLLDDDDLDVSSVDQSDLMSSLIDDNDSDLYENEDLFIEEIMNNYHQEQSHIPFRAHDSLPNNANSDGYIPKGNQELTSTISENPKTFKLYSKDGHNYVLYNEKYYQIDGTGTVTIGGTKYDKMG